jgi:hypothetical protein
MEEKMNQNATAASDKVAGESRQEQQANLVEQGEKLPGVAEAMVAYRRFAPHVPPTAAPSSAPVVYSTGGNAS